MGYLLHIFLAFGVQALGETRSGAAMAPLYLAPLLLMVPHLLGAWSRISALHGNFKRAERVARCVGLSGVLCFALLVHALGWLDAVQGWIGSAAALSGPDLSLLVALAPYLLLQALAIDAQVRAQAATPGELRRGRGFQLRMFASSLVPVAIYFALSFVVGLREDVRVHVERVALYQAAFLTFLMFTLALFLPRLLAATWETVPLPNGPERTLLGVVGERAGFRARELFMWRTGHSMANAAIVGLFPGTRIVLFSDSLLSLLGPRELAAVYGHEIGHAVRRHVTIFLCWALAFFLGGDLLAQALAPEDVWLGTGIVVGAVGFWMLIFGWLSRRFELEADLFSLELLGDPSGLIGALERLGGRLRDVAGWRHFSTADRVRFLERAWSEDGFARRFRRRLRVLSWLGALLAIGALGGQLWSLVDRLGEDRVYAELGLGRYDRAARRAVDLGLEEDLIEVCQLGAALAPGIEHVPLWEVETALGAELRGSDDLEDVARALSYAQLMVLRERADLLPLAQQLEEWLEEERVPTGEALTELRQRFLETPDLSVPDPE